VEEEEAGPRIESGVTGEAEAPAWVPQFLAGLIVTGSVRQAVAEAGIDFDTAWALRQSEPAFAFYWDKAALVNMGLAEGLSLGEAVGIADGGLDG
jgi:hypothetical protein